MWAMFNVKKEIVWNEMINGEQGKKIEFCVRGCQTESRGKN